MTVKVLDFRCEDTTIKAAVKTVTFTVASERARGNLLVKLIHREEKESPFVVSLRRSLRRLKTAGRVECIIKGRDFSDASNEALFLVNKYPALASDEHYGGTSDTMTLLYLNAHL